jgi:hypothetical protein
LGFLHAQTREARTPVGVRQYSIPFLLEYNLHDPKYNRHDSEYNRHDPEYNCHNPEYNRHDPENNCHDPLYRLYFSRTST